MRDLILEKLGIVKELITSMNSDVVLLINTTALIEIKLKNDELNKKDYKEIESELDLLITKYSQ